MDPKKANIVLDLDNTLLSALASEEFPWKNRKYKKALGSFVTHNMDDTTDGKLIFVIHERPGLQPFLDFLFKNFNVHIWTAASHGYMAVIIDKIIVPVNKPDRQLGWALCSYHGKSSKKVFNGPKNLKLLFETWNIPNMNPGNTMILDDHAGVKKDNGGNCVHVIEFELDTGGQFDDKEIGKIKEMSNDDYLKRAKKSLQEYQKRFSVDGKVDDPASLFPEQPSV
jgi:hypothetical protein